ncbi:MAG: AAA family ATPase, partial [Pseudomonadota bacterium]
MTHISRLRLANFRNYAELGLAFDARPVCLFGPNGAGKTNLLEAVSQLGPGRGLRSAAIQTLNQSGADNGWAVSAEIDGRRIGVGLEQNGATAKRVIRVDGAPASATDLSELARIVWLTPAMDRVWAGPASDRRRFLDRQVLAHIPSHGRAAATYEAAMRERNALLERGGGDPAWITAIEARMAEAGAQLAWNRAHVISGLQSTIDSAADGAFPKADLGLDGASEAAAAEGRDPVEIGRSLMEKWRESRRRDAAAARTLEGPHRTELTAIHRPTGAPAALAS